VTPLEEVGLETKFHQPDFFDGVFRFAGARQRRSSAIIVSNITATAGTSRKWLDVSRLVQLAGVPRSCLGMASSSPIKRI
jgi:hypothetical protein